MARKKYDVAIVGSGPSGMSAALELVRSCPDLKIVILEKGPQRTPEDRNNKDLVACGWGGAGTFSDGKLNLTGKVGGHLLEVISEEEFAEYINYIDRQYAAFGGERGNVKKPKEAEAKRLKIEALGAGFKDFIYYPTRHWGTDKAFVIAENIRIHLLSRGVEILCGTEITGIEPCGEGFSLLGKNGEELESDLVIMALGRGGNICLSPPNFSALS